MQGDFLIKVRAVYNQFTKAEKKVADYILQHPKDVLFMSITDLAEACNVGDTSVFRFCKTMNLKGYQEFKMMLSLSLHEGTARTWSGLPAISAWRIPLRNCRKRCSIPISMP